MPRRKIYNRNIVKNRSKLNRRRVNNMPKHSGKTSYTSILKIISSLVFVSAILFAAFYYISTNPIEIKPVKIVKEIPTTNIVIKNTASKENIFKNNSIELQAHLTNEDIIPVKTQAIKVEEIKNIEVPTAISKRIKEKLINAKHIVKNISANTKKTNEKEIHKLYEEPVDNHMIVVDHKDDMKKIDVNKHETFKIAVVIDDMGINRKRTKNIAKLNYPITSSYLSYARDIPQQVKIAQNSGHQIIIHVPMQPKGKNINAGPNVITQGMEKEKIAKILNHSIDLFPMAEGINNHMGSKLTESKAEIEEVMKILSQRGLFFLDSKTTSKSVCRDLAKKYNVKYIARNIFIDNKDDKDYVLSQLNKTVNIAKKNGYAIAIGHPKKGTVEALKVWLPHLSEKNIEIVKLNDLLPK